MEKLNDPIANIDELLNQLEKLNLSPLPASSKETQNIKKDVTLCIRKIVLKFDSILSHKLRLDLTQKNITQETNHYWSYISKYYQIPSVKFCNIYSKVQRLPEKGMLWILLSITEKSFNESINEIYKQSFDKKFYDKSSIIVSKKSDILALCAKLNSIHLIEVKTDINEEYFSYKQGYQTKKEKEAINDELDFLSPIIQRPIEKNIYVSNIEVIPIDKKNTNLNSCFFSKATLDLLPMNIMQGQENDGTGIDDLFFGIENDDNETNDNDIEGGGAKSHKMTKGQRRSSMTKPDDGNKMSFFTSLGNDKENPCRITKVADFQSIFKDEFYSFKDKMKKQTSFVISKKKTETVQPGEEQLSSKVKNDLVLNPKKRMHFPFDKNFKATRRADKAIYTKKDVILYKGKEIALTNSVLFYLNHFYKKEGYYHFKTKINSSKPITIESQNYQCALCNRKFPTLMSIPTESIYWCSYFLRFVCKDCISEEYSIIPDFIIKFWTFKKFPISINAKKLFEQWYKKPVIYLKQTDLLIKKSEQIHLALLLKRKIHKIFDLMKCERASEFVMETLGDYKYLVLHENLLSLQDLVEINDKSFFVKLKGFLWKMQQHIISDCPVCDYKGGQCIMCMSKEVIYAFDVEFVIYCNDCKKMFHKKCCTVHPCIINR